MPFLRLTRDRRGYENTFLLHAREPGARPRVLYWYRTAPGVQVGRPALDEDAIRTIEEQHPEIDFDWPHILEVGAMTPPEVERRPDRPRRKPQRPRDDRDEREEAAMVPGAAVAPLPEPALAAALGAPLEAEAEDDLADDEPELAPPPPAHSLLEQLVGREIATRLRGRYAEINARIHERVTDPAAREIWQTRAAALDPDSWVTADEILLGVSRADELFDALRRDLFG